MSAGGAGQGLAVEDASLRLPDGRTLFSGLSLSVAPGETLTLMGPSGSGKSSLLHWMCGFPARGLSLSGRATLDGVDLAGAPPEARRLGMLFQDDLLFPHLSAAGNLAFGLRGPSGRGRRRARRARIEAALEEAELAGRGRMRPHQLSGGQRARLSLMRTLLSEPRALLLDEPFSRLDAPLRARIRSFVLRHAGARGLPILLVTHDAADAEAAGGRVLRLEDHAPGAP